MGVLSVVGEDGTSKEFTFESHHYDRRHGLVHELQIFLDEISKYPHCDFRFGLSNELITKPALALLVQLLNQPYISQSEPRTTITRDKTTKWRRLEFIECRFALPNTGFQPREDNELYCTHDDIQIFGSTVARGTTSLRLEVHEWPDILHAVCNAPQLAITKWEIEKVEFSALDCSRLANGLQRSVRPPTRLHLSSNYIEDPLVLAEGLVNITDRVYIAGATAYHRNAPSPRRSYPSMGNILVGEGGTGMMQMLLQSPSCQLRCLSLPHMQLDDRHFMAIVDMLPKSQLEELILSLNDISLHGIMAFAHQLPRITSLTKVFIGIDNSEKDPVHLQECCMALTQGMRENYSIEELFVGVLNFSRYNACHFYADLNHAGRRILATSKPVPAGLWPRILERAGTKCFRRCRVCTMESQAIRRVNSIYFLLRNCQALLAVH